ncbi:TetR/AcrR family transcriptional regulator [Streptomyces sp. LS1784]|uniref:TetR/AcrR family transcriptional regulator n=1 Tax=Streptomyces sp. LS1784 TaxID=2851533 RepID=UPI001CCBE0F6|nr:TetR/AcrR family transcriptional regulator [Streptomyces sp. LS1784]
MSNIRGLSGKGAQRREQLLDTAEELLVTEGGTELTMRTVATAAGVRLGHLQHYFPTHAELVAAVLGRVLDRSVERLGPLLDPGRAEDALLGELLAEQQDPRLVRLFAELWALAARDPAVAAAVRAFYDRYRELVAAFLAGRHPGLTEEQRHARARVFIMLVEGASLFRSGLAGTAEPAADAELLHTARALLGP